MAFVLPQIHINEQSSWGPPEVQGGKIETTVGSLYHKREAVEPFDWLRVLEPVEGGRQREFTIVEDEKRNKILKSTRVKERRQVPDWSAPRRHQNSRRNFQNKPKRNITLPPDTVKVPSDAVILEQFRQAELAKMPNLTSLPTVSDISQHNRPPVYKNEMDKASCKAPIPLNEKETKVDFTRSDSFTDNVLRGILKSEPPGTYPIVVATDEVLALLMTCSRSVYSWHLHFYRVGRFYFISKVDGCNVEKQWVDETADVSRVPSETEVVETDRTSSLEAESSKVNNFFVAQSCTAARYQMDCEKSPFPGKHPRLYRYRRFVMHADTKDRYDLIVRCEVDAMQGDKHIRLFGLLEHCIKGEENDWRKMLASQTATCISEEYRRNAQKMARWIALCHLSGAHMKIGFISRCRKGAGVFDPLRHEVLATFTNDPSPLAAQLGIKVANMWTVADTIITAFVQSDFSEAALVKRSGDTSILLVEKCEEEFYEEEEDEEDDDEEDDDDDGEEDG
ncbi:eukaryotic translation initiation factor 3 subunit 7-like protein [Trypanosoma brucei brucei TREU927]|uniref:Eukaryotic translation initiation factor 3 subunit 7-like protein n=1 Tax=Trypanosoma brucei brucei (strain 927/4 GUTat10.1) TaxID=185431 RepID=Q587A3_TRYB2|nr:eukaryotic translation initiation factor 3 subunit 7-like protein [Trypanosoma brucei brucei TREU927]AAX79274.1 eukaryotic translation initiation factor 3 subunit 7-like protein [Trypanosoma brucei]AAZ11995.1 eukaryotic translation initiation factor 3 subunit 7-like protein [Trypanosoma brucei brucei TREU927]